MAPDTEFVRGRGTARAQRIAAKLGITDKLRIATLRDVYLVAYEFPAPLMVRVADEMLADLHADVASRHTDRVVALGRTGGVSRRSGGHDRWISRTHGLPAGASGASRTAR